MLGRRIWIARLLLEGRDYEDIGSELKVSYATIYRVDRWLNDQMPGYGDAIKEMNEEFKRRKLKFSQNTDPFTFKRLRKRYPMHFLLFNLFSSS